MHWQNHIQYSGEDKKWLGKYDKNKIKFLIFLLSEYAGFY